MFLDLGILSFSSCFVNIRQLLTHLLLLSIATSIRTLEILQAHIIVVDNMQYPGSVIRRHSANLRATLCFA